jgi:V/A-type H+-transporting ATPase subunit D
MAEIIEGARPTRMELLKIKDKLALAVKGHRLLKEKRDALIMEFMNLSRQGHLATGEAVDFLQVAKSAFGRSRAVLGSSSLAVTCLDAGSDFEVDVNFRNVMGVNLAEIDAEGLEKPDVGYSLYSTKPIVDETSEKYFAGIKKLLKLTEIEYGLNALKDETKKTKRRVNALEHRRIPQLKSTKKYIELRLDELERENYYRLKMVKKKKGRENDRT